MEKLTFSVDIDARAEVVWNTMLDDATYRRWTRVFHEGSRFIGDWELGSTIRFVGPDDTAPGTVPEDSRDDGGLLGVVVERRTNEYIGIEYRGLIVRGADDTTSAEAKRFAGARENYAFDEHDGATTLTVDLDTDAAYAEMFRDLWPRALDQLKAVAEDADHHVSAP
jgi:uncharacterized protein YndB with AHSA1/START domain